MGRSLSAFPIERQPPWLHRQAALPSVQGGGDDVMSTCHRPPPVLLVRVLSAFLLVTGIANSQSQLVTAMVKSQSQLKTVMAERALSLLVMETERNQSP